MAYCPIFGGLAEFIIFNHSSRGTAPNYLIPLPNLLIKNTTLTQPQDILWVFRLQYFAFMGLGFVRCAIQPRGFVSNASRSPKPFALSHILDDGVMTHTGQTDRGAKACRASWLVVLKGT